MKVVQSEFEKYLKNSDHFSGAMNAQRAATAEVVAAFALLLVESNHVPKEAINKLLKGLEDASSGPSIDGSRRALVALISDAVNRR